VSNTSVFSLLIVFLLAVAVPAVVMVASALTGPKCPNLDKLDVYECGLTPKSYARRRISVKFYLVAVLFILFDIEIAFMYPWAVRFKELGAVGLAAMSAFMLVLGVGLVYTVRKGALRWD
jgi:NADH-quinone oxidoreductase subunit A